MLTVILIVFSATTLSFAQTRFICVFNNFACLSPNQEFWLIPYTQPTYALV
jgi:hypothetical protein